jgi:Na+/H+ antiporter NhaC
MLPIVIPMAYTLGAPLPASIGAVLSGGLFGDHASPISDTTILSSTGAGCDHIDHVRTQLPYALLTGVVSVFVFALAGITGSPWTLVVAVALLPVLFVTLAVARGVRIPRK